MAAHAADEPDPKQLKKEQAGNATPKVEQSYTQQQIQSVQQQEELKQQTEEPAQTGQSAVTSNLQSVFFLDSQRGWAVGGGGTVLSTQDGGNRWQAQTSNSSSHLNSVYFLDPQRGWAVGGVGTVLSTQDGGNRWQVQSSGTASWLESVQFLDPQRGWGSGIRWHCAQHPGRRQSLASAKQRYGQLA